MLIIFPIRASRYEYQMVYSPLDCEIAATGRSRPHIPRGTMPVPRLPRRSRTSGHGNTGAHRAPAGPPCTLHARNAPIGGIG